MNLYKRKINEFVDWKTGRNSFTGQNVTGGLQVSGGSIRELIQDKLKNPFYMYEDKANNRYRMFSSEDAYSMWKDDPSNMQDLELFNFVRPSDYKLDLTATDSNGFDNKYIRLGDSENAGARISYRWNIYNDEGESSDSLSVTYTITNVSSGNVTQFTRWYNRSDANPNFSIYNYLAAGENTVQIEARGTSTGARNTKSFTIILLQINITSTFRFYDRFSAYSPIQIPYVFERNNTTGTAKIYFRIDNGGGAKDATRDVVANGPSRVTETQMILAQLSEGQHTLQIWVEAKYNDGQTTVHSNLLYYTFTVASSVVGSTGKFINIHSSFTSGDFPLSNLMLNATQYEAQQLQWGYYTDSLQTNTSIQVTWKLLDGLDDANPTSLGTTTARNQEKAQPLQYVPTIYTEDGHSTYLCAYFRNQNQDILLASIPIYIIENTKVKVNETGFYQMKMSAYGRTNESNDKNTWLDVMGNANTTFTNIQWNTNSGWYNNSFRTCGINEYATINFQPFDQFSFDTGKTIEIEFESEKVANDDDVLVTIGSPTGARIEITPDTATLYSNALNESQTGNREIVHTNYKSNERIKLAFIINSIPEDSNSRTVQSGLAYIVNNGILERSAIASGQSFANNGTIKIGGAGSGVRVYSIRIYNYSISYSDAYNNYLYDSDNKATIADNNNILDSSDNISFDLCKNKIDTILISGDLSNILSGQSNKQNSTTDVTLERFCPFDASKNFKINNIQIRKHGQSTLNYPITSMKFWLNKSKSGITPIYESTQQDSLLLNKNRYVMKSYTDSGKPSIPANKFVLQANYADSSGVHNGSLQRLIQSTWFNAQIDGEFKLRTAPQLFSTNKLIHHNNENLHETGWVEGYGVGNRQWSDVTAADFPYDIRIAPDSFPCAVFYYDESGTQTRTFLGQYVWMDDKKSDFCFGERSIYGVPSDPFCLTNTHKDEDTSENKVWDNGNVLRVEVLGSNTPFTSYMTHNNFTQIVEVENEATGNIERKYNWEQVFEMVFPDEDDLNEKDANDGIDKWNPNSRYVRKIQPFIDFHEWVASTYQNQAKFEAEAAQHLDLYKMAAYYIFVLRFGLVDSLERNAQIKTYDGVHWHYEPWDMDIALGNKNDGGIAYEPPIDRDTKLPGSVTTYAISGRSANNDGTIATSNWLFDALEAWGYWANTIVPKVADALYNAGLTYDRISSMFDDNYAAKWCEIMYNQSGYFKYIESGNGDPTWLSWLQGSRMTHRHWWLSNSMDYYDAKWFCGDYKNHFIYIRANVTEGSNANIRIVPNKATYMSLSKDDILQTTQPVSQLSPFVYSMSAGSNTKNPILVYGANFMEEINLSEIALGLDGVELDGVYSEVLGSPLKVINVGTPLTQTQNGYETTVGVSGCQLQGAANVFKNLTTLNIRGQRNQTDLHNLVYNYDLSELANVYAMGSGITNFYSSEAGNNFIDIEIPDTVYTFYVNNSTWANLSFWNCSVGNNNVATLTEVSGIPTTLHDISLLGTTGSTRESIGLVRSWINALVAADADLSQYTLKMDKINWTEDTVGANNLLTYQELSYIAQLGSESQLKGYLVLRDTGTELTSAQLNNIKSWFGDTVFTKNSAGLVVDHKREYVQINIGGNVTVSQNGDVTLVEGNNASLNATRFSLAEDDTTQYSWAVGPVNSVESYVRYNGLTVIQQEDSIDGIAYIQSTQSQIGQDYDVKVTCSVAGINYSTVIHITAASYPTSMFIDVQNRGSVNPRSIPGYTELYVSGQAARLFVNSNDTYTGTIRSVTYTFTRLSDNAHAVYIQGGSTSELTNFRDDYISLTADTDSGIKVSADTAMPSDGSLKLYQVDARVLFTSGTEKTATAKLVIGDDNTPIVMSNQSAMYTAINAAWTTQYGSGIGRNNIYKVDLMSLTEDIDFSSAGANLPSLVTADGYWLFKYLPNCQGINMDGCTAITSEHQSIVGVNKNQMDFSNMTKLQRLSIQNCTGLTADIDLSMCPDIEEVDASGTTINVLVPSASKLTKYELGTPTSVSLINPTALTAAGTKVDVSTNIASVDIVNMPNNKSFSTFAKIMNIS